jgi:hypothetical protein
MNNEEQGSLKKFASIDCHLLNGKCDGCWNNWHGIHNEYIYL